jgi:GT2 family glycosyltransferase
MPEVCIVIVTRNRKEMVTRAVESAVRQKGDVETLVVDDGSTDGTCDWLRSRFPDVHVHRCEQHQGAIVQRSLAATLTTAPIIFSIDDDAVFEGDDVIENILPDFADPRVGALAVRHVNHYQARPDQEFWPRADATPEFSVVRTYIGCAAAFRRDLFLQVGGYCNDLVHWAEEPELCQRIYMAGYLVRLARKGFIHHYPDWAGKYTVSLNRYIVRNRILIAWFHTPAIFLPPALAVAFAQGIRPLAHGTAARKASVQGLAMAVVDMVRLWKHRRAMTISQFLTQEFLRRRGVVSIDEYAARANRRFFPDRRAKPRAAEETSVGGSRHA